MFIYTAHHTITHYAYIEITEATTLRNIMSVDLYLDVLSYRNRSPQVLLSHFSTSRSIYLFKKLIR